MAKRKYYWIVARRSGVWMQYPTVTPILYTSKRIAQFWANVENDNGPTQHADYIPVRVEICRA